MLKLGLGKRILERSKMDISLLTWVARRLLIMKTLCDFILN